MPKAFLDHANNRTITISSPRDLVTDFNSARDQFIASISTIENEDEFIEAVSKFGKRVRSTRTYLGNIEAIKKAGFTEIVSEPISKVKLS